MIVPSLVGVAALQHGVQIPAEGSRLGAVHINH